MKPLAATFAALPLPALAQQAAILPPATTTATTIEPLAGVGQMIFGLVAVLAILVACVWLLRRFAEPLRGSGAVRVLGATAVGPREKVVLVEAGEKVLMLGVTAANVRTLHVFARDELPLAASAATTPPPGAAIVASFANRLRDAIKGRRDAG
ncbi:MAG: flagellar biosynthetic protein FliO [Azoarcus sp.]|jgi:flagellar protein FliO/FliZ|nr:flagellar biosynthetic protein FliO [Azoarcus sp.]